MYTTQQDATHKDRTRCVCITYLCMLMVLRGTIAIYSENPQLRSVSKPQRFLSVKAGDTYHNHYVHAGRKITIRSLMTQRRLNRNGRRRELSPKKLETLECSEGM
jgi:hypothetical protein